jgi:hypothetical protein
MQLLGWEAVGCAAPAGLYHHGDASNEVTESRSVKRETRNGGGEGGR